MEKLIPYIIGVTPRFYEYRKRGNEIKYWMDMLSTDYNVIKTIYYIKNYVILLHYLECSNMCKLDWVDEEHILSNLARF